MKSFLLRLAVDEDGPTAVEYAVLTALIIAVCIGSVQLLANETGNSLNSSAAELNGIMGS